MINLFNEDAILNIRSIRTLSDSFLLFSKDILLSNNRDMYDGLNEIRRQKMLMNLQEENVLVDVFNLYINKIIATKNIIIQSMPLSTFDYKLSNFEYFVLDGGIKHKFEELLIALNDPVNFEYYIKLAFLNKYTQVIFPYSQLFFNNGHVTLEPVNSLNCDTIKNHGQEKINEILTDEKESIREYAELIKFYYPFICSLFGLKELFNGDKNTTIYESLTNDITYDHLLDCQNFIVNKKQLEAKKKFLEAYMKKELPDLYESGAVKILTE